MVLQTQDCSVCPGSAFTSIGAAFATQGYWLQADVLHMLNFTSFKDLAILFYVLAAIGGIISMGLGMPPKLYLWFFIGPGIFHWLVATPANVNGVQWLVANKPQAQTEVWKLAEAGLRNTRIFRSGNYQLDTHAAPNSLPYFLEPSNGPWGDGTVQVAHAFVWFDEAVSSVIQSMVSWFGAYSQLESTSGDGNLNTYASTDGPWHLLSNLKWGMLEDITAARLHNGDLRDLFVTFLGSECGDKLKLAINNANFVAASNSKGTTLPNHVITNVEEFHRLLASQEIPTPQAVQNLFTENKLAATGKYMPGSFRASIDVFSIDFLKFFGMDDSISCSRLFYIIVNGFRWEAGHIYAQFLGAAPRYLGPDRKTPDYMTPEMVLQTLYYGWDIKKYDGGSGAKLTANQIEQFTINLIIIHLFRNEMIAAPRIQHVRKSATTESQEYSDIALKTTGAKAKYGELYEWARMVPYIQGVLLYYLALAYPFACMMMVVPGWHKMLFTWMSFWAWAKLWDLGFAVVMMAERSIWAMIGNSADASRVFGRVADMDNHGSVIVKCFGAGGGGGISSSRLPCRSLGSGAENVTYVPDIAITDAVSTGLGTTITTPSWTKVIDIFDQAITIGTTIDLDRSNAYYIYIMAGLYFAVPMVTGQMVLGSKAGMAGFVKDIIGGAASEAGRAAASGFTANQTAIAQANSASLGQAAAAKGYRQSGLAKQAMDIGNMQLAEGLASATRGQERAGIDAYKGNMQMGRETTQSNLQAANMLGKNGMARPGQFLPAMAGANLAGALDILAPEQKQWHDAHLGIKQQGGGAASGGGGNGKLQTMAPMGTTGSAFSGTGRTGQDPRASGPIGRGGQMLAGLSRPIDLAFDTAQALENNALAQKYNGIGAHLNAVGTQLGFDSFQHGQYAQGLGTHGGRVSAQAQFAAQTGQWEAKMQYANQASGALAAMGVQPGTLSPGPKPEDMTGMAMSGMLGSATQQAANYAAPGGEFFKAVNSDYAGLQSRFGYSQLVGAYASNVQGWQPILQSSFQRMNQVSGAFNSASGSFGQKVNAALQQGGNYYSPSSPSGYSPPIKPMQTSTYKP